MMNDEELCWAATENLDTGHTGISDTSLQNLPSLLVCAEVPKGHDGQGGEINYIGSLWIQGSGAVVRNSWTVRKSSRVRDRP